MVQYADALNHIELPINFAKFQDVSLKKANIINAQLGGLSFCI